MIPMYHDKTDGQNRLTRSRKFIGSVKKLKLESGQSGRLYVIIIIIVQVCLEISVKPMPYRSYPIL